MRRKLAAALHFYRRFAAFSVLITAGMCWMLWKEGAVFFTPALFIKSGILGISLWIANHSAGSTMFFYYNLGVSKRQLFAAASVFDAVLFVLPAIFILWLRPNTG